MKKTIKLIALGLAMCMLFNSCATVFGGMVDRCQRTKPDKAKGEPSRPLRGAALVCDIVLGGIVAVAIDFATCAIYKPCGAAAKQNNVQK